MPGTEISELDLLLHLARALPPGRRLRIRVQALLDAELADRLRRLRREQALFEADVRPDLLGRLRRRLPRAAAAENSAAGTAARPLRLASAIQALESGLARPKAIYIWVALSTLTIAALLLSPYHDGYSMGASGAMGGDGKHVRPPLILGY